MNPTKDPVWDWDTETSSVEDTDQNWSEVSLGSEEDQPLGGTLEFQREDLAVSDDNLDAHILDNIQLNEVTGDAGDQDIDSSLAYKLGMLVVSGAAQVVNNVADGGRQHRDTIKKLRTELDASLEDQEKLKSDLKAAKEWVTFCEQGNSELEQRLEDQTKQYEIDFAKLNEQHENSLEEAGKSSQEKSDKIISELKSKLDESTRKVAALLEKKTSLESRVSAKNEEIEKFKINSRSLNVEANQASCSAASPYGELIATIEHKDKQLEDATRALSITHTRCDQLRNQLMTSMNSMRSQTEQMRSSTKTLGLAMDEARELREKVKVAEEKSRDIEERLQGEEKLKMEALTQLSLKEEAIQDLTNKIKQLNVQHVNDATTLKNLQAHYKAKEQELNEKLAKNETQLALQVAKNEQQEILHKNYIESLKAKSTANTDRLLAKSTEFKDLEKQLKSAKVELQHFQENLNKNSAESFGIVESSKAKIAALENEVKSTQQQCSEMKEKCGELQVKLDESLQSRKDELARANVKFRNLTRENSTLKSTQQRVKVSSVSQTDNSKEKALEDQLEEVKNEKVKLVKKLQHLGVFPDDVSTTSPPTNLERVIEHDRWTIYHQEHEIRGLRHQLQRLDWIHHQDRATLMRLSRQNSAYYKYLYGNRQPNNRHQQPNERGDHLDAIPEEKTQVVDEARQELTPVRSMPPQIATPVIPSNITPRTSSELGSLQLNTNPQSEDQDLQPIENNLNISSSTSNEKPAVKETSKKLRKKRKRSSKKEKRSSTSSLEEELRSSLRMLPIWRQENPDNHNFDPTYLERLITEKQSQIDDESSRTLDNKPSSSNQQQGDYLRHRKSLNSLKDDGYASSINSELHRSNNRRRLYSSATNDSVFLPNDGDHYVINGNDITHHDVILNTDDDALNSDDVTNHVDDITNNNDDQHYYVTFNSVTFDIATFDLQRMRQVTSTFTSEEMPEFCDFMAQVARDIATDPVWRGRHKLGTPSDWVEFKNSF